MKEAVSHQRSAISQSKPTDSYDFKLPAGAECWMHFEFTGARKEGSNRDGDSVYVMQHCTHSHFEICEIINIHAATLDIACDSSASLQRFSDITYRPQMVRGGMRFTRVKCGAGAR
jgi:hypothetical protein